MFNNPFAEYMGDPTVTVPQTIQYIDKVYNAPKMTASQILGAESVTQIGLDNNIYFELQQRQGMVGIPKMSERAARSGQKIPDRVVSSRTFKVPHYDVQDELKADDFRGKKMFGVNEEFTRNCINEKLAEKIQTAYDCFALLREFNLFQAINGYIKNGLEETRIDVYAETGLTRKEFQVDFGKTNDADIYGLTLDVTTYQAGALAGALATGRVAFCSPQFFKKLSMNRHVVEVNKYQNSEFLRDLHLNGFLYNNVFWILYNEYTVDNGKVYPWLANGTAKVVPMGVAGLFDQVNAPADTVQGLLEETKEQYSTFRLNEDETGFKIDAQTNQVTYCTRPETIVTLVDVDYKPSKEDADGVYIPPVFAKDRR